MGQRPLFGSWFPSEDIFLDEHTNVLGRPPEDMWARWTNRKSFFDDQLRRINGKRRQLLEEWIEYSIRESRRELKMADMGEQEKYDFLILMRSMLEFRPENRPSMREVLKSGWMQK
jgi:serine/threonine-protein kinase SRPK3